MRERWVPDARRNAVADAVGRLLMRGHGTFPGMREIAAEAGVTTGTLQHHFGTKDDLLLFALEHHCRRCADRLTARSEEGARSPRQALAVIVTELLPLDEERAAETSVAKAFVSRAATDPGFAAHYRAQRKILLDLLGEQFARADVPDPSAAATILARVIEGMRTDCLLLGPDAVDVDAVLDRLLRPRDTP
ncbi:TetR family transcriptional regulator [Herbidospora sp. NEAU-GS84]|uniref:TetR family transcriptional regulator n=1 Tax=Herbidospora solisilvae TaxID=2696284 RepID=A0A7C9J6R0_9ACTN|nr:TetR/AcrR family transcriptional regulator [Herbidospora solisilvae]NAS25300.1 TetR family transcriptional regulator [Herbidospora solisilvae]